MLTNVKNKKGIKICDNYNVDKCIYTLLIKMMLNLTVFFKHNFVVVIALRHNYSYCYSETPRQCNVNLKKLTLQKIDKYELGFR